jgi:anti-sigma regulatory factor (Ser/Thr protein kinase)
MADRQAVGAMATRTFTADPDEVAATREFVGECTQSWGIDGTDVVLMASELATNVVLHGRTEFRVTMRSDGHVLRLEVDDRDPHAVVPRPASPEATSGRGLALIVALADEWGVECRDDGKCVWVEIRLRAR